MNKIKMQYGSRKVEYSTGWSTSYAQRNTDNRYAYVWRAVWARRVQYWGTENRKPVMKLFHPLMHHRCRADYQHRTETHVTAAYNRNGSNGCIAGKSYRTAPRVKYTESQ